MLAWSLRMAWRQQLLVKSRLHVLVHKYSDWQPKAWQDLLGEAVALLGGLHMCNGLNRYPWFNMEFTLRQRDNYYNKVFMMLGLAKVHSYKYLVSFDDDVYLP